MPVPIGIIIVTQRIFVYILIVIQLGLHIYVCKYIMFWIKQIC